ncbi:hypothetical protein [Flavobacterium soli]|uniref:hypothetical protein n=1 Tax=Flavobacterium soli TaxID=344881 RepID=UPI000410C4A4|nr:hypothetical protein [Flavobacterium soli]
MFGNILKNDPLFKMFKGSTPRRRRTSRKRGLNASQKQIVNAVVRRVKPRRRRY